MSLAQMKKIAKQRGYKGIGGGKYKTPGKNTVKWTGKDLQDHRWTDVSGWTFPSSRA
jgi:hypothetical protein